MLKSSGIVYRGAARRKILTAVVVLPAQLSKLCSLITLKDTLIVKCYSMIWQEFQLRAGPFYRVKEMLSGEICSDIYVHDSGGKLRVR